MEERDPEKEGAARLVHFVFSSFYVGFALFFPLSILPLLYVCEMTGYSLLCAERGRRVSESEERLLDASKVQPHARLRDRIDERIDDEAGSMPFLAQNCAREGSEGLEEALDIVGGGDDLASTRRAPPFPHLLAPALRFSSSRPAASSVDHWVLIP